MAENIKIELPQLQEFDERIDRLSGELIALKADRQEILNAEARKVAQHQAGDEIEKGKRRYKITSVEGEYHAYDNLPTILWVRYRGHQVFKKGTIGRTERIYLR